MIFDESLLSTQAGFVKWLRKAYRAAAVHRPGKSEMERRVAEKIRCYDPVLADKLVAAADALDDLYAYVRRRFEVKRERAQTGQN